VQTCSERVEQGKPTLPGSPVAASSSIMQWRIGFHGGYEGASCGQRGRRSTHLREGVEAPIHHKHHHIFVVLNIPIQLMQQRNCTIDTL
jgi:hypothetical protein